MVDLIVFNTVYFMFLILILEICFATTFVFSKKSLMFSDVAFFIACRMLISGITLSLYKFLNDKKSFVKLLKEWKMIFVISLFGIFLTNLWEYIGLKTLTAGKTCFIYSFSPYISAFFSYFILKERMSIKKWIASLGAFAGMFFILIDDLNANDSAPSLLMISKDEFLVIAAAGASVFGWVFMRKLVKGSDYSIVSVNGLITLFGGIIAILYSLLRENWNPIPVSADSYGEFFLWMIITTLINNFICYSLYVHLLKKFSATFISIAGGITPLFAVLFGWIFLGESVRWNFWVACSLLLPSLYVFHSEEIKSNVENG